MIFVLLNPSINWDDISIGEAKSFKADVSIPGDSELIVKEAVKHFGKIDIYFANAGVVGPMGPFIGNRYHDNSFVTILSSSILTESTAIAWLLFFLNTRKKKVSSDTFTCPLR